MPIFTTNEFVIGVVCCYVLVQLRVPIPRTTWWGLINLGVVGFIFGLRPLLVLLSVSVVYWAAIAGGVRLRRDETERPRATRFAGVLVPWVLYSGAACLFIMHKSLLEPANPISGFFPIAPVARLASVPVVGDAMRSLRVIAAAFVTLRLVDLVRSVLDGRRLLDPLALSGYLAPFFMTPAGPVNVYGDHAEMDDQPSEGLSIGHFIDCTFTITLGYFLKFVLARMYEIFVVGVNGPWPNLSVADTAQFLFYVFLEFSGYSLIALGVGRLLGVPTPVNFNHPYLATSLGEFWSRWHMSLGAFVRNNLYFPLQVALMRRYGRGNRRRAYVCNLFALWCPFVLVGLWHRFSYSFVAWGIFVGAIVATEKLARDRIAFFHRERETQTAGLFLKLLGITYTLAAVLVTLNLATKEFFLK